MLLVMRIVAVVAWCIVGKHGLSDSVAMEIVLTAASDLILLSMTGAAGIYYGRKATSTLTFEDMTAGIATYSVSTLALLLFGAIVPMRVVDDHPADVLSVITSHLVALGTFGVSIGLAGFLGRVLLYRRVRRRAFILVGLASLLLMIWLFGSLSDVHGGFAFVAGFALTIGFFIILFSTRPQPWLATITMDKKLRLLWLTVCGGFASLVLAMLFAVNSDIAVRTSADLFVRNGAILPSAINALGFAFFVRLLFSILAALPNSGIVDRRSSEVQSLAALNRLVADTPDSHELFKAVTRYALDVCRAHGAWAELYGPDSSVQVVAAQLVRPEYVEALHANVGFRTLVRQAERPQLLDTIENSIGMREAALAMRALITVPLLVDHQRIGTLAVFSTIDHGLAEDDLALLTAFGDQISIGLEQHRLLQAAIENERLQREFDVARRIQYSLVPRKAAQFDGADVAAVMLPATDVGGDYYDYVTFADGTKGALIADVSGKGIPAALYMATLKGVVLAEARESTGPGDLLRRVNITLHGAMERATYITMLCVAVRPVQGLLVIARAGHTPAIVVRNGIAESLRPAGLAIGIAPPSVFDNVLEEISVHVTAGDVCLLTTDGVNERRNSARAELGMEPLEYLAATGSFDTAAALVAETIALTDEHAAGADQHDDLTIVGLVMTDRRHDETSSVQQRMEPSYGV